MSYLKCQQESFPHLEHYSSVLELDSHQEVIKQTAVTQDYKAQDLKVLQSRSKKKIGKLNYEISFESCFLDSHKQSFKISFLAYTWKVNDLIGQKKFQEELNFSSSLNQDFQLSSWISEVLKSHEGINTIQKQQLQLDWLKQQHFVKYLRFVCESVDPVLMSCFIKLAYIIWQKYLESFFSKKMTDMNKFLGLVSQNVNQIYEQQQLDGLTLSSFKKGEIKNEFKTFFNFWAQTLFLVIEGYFINPLQVLNIQSGDHNNVQLKSSIDPFSEFSDSHDFFVASSPKKMTKFD